ncbi:hypothetical protein D3C81_190680 [compost metagenome]
MSSIKFVRVVEEIGLSCKPELVYQLVQVEVPSWDNTGIIDAFTLVLKGEEPEDHSLTLDEHDGLMMLQRLSGMAELGGAFCHGYHISRIRTLHEDHKRANALREMPDSPTKSALTQALLTWREERKTIDRSEQIKRYIPA